MGEVLRFVGAKTAFNGRRRHRVRLRVIDTLEPEETRWSAQRAMQNASGFSALAGFTDRAARIQKWHSFSVSQALISRFARQIRHLAEGGLVEIRVDGNRLVFPRRRRA